MEAPDDLQAVRTPIVSSFSEPSLSPKPSVWRRLCCCFGPSNEEDVTPEHKHLKQKIAKYSTMRVHMKRVQLCLEQEKRNQFYKELLVYLIFLVMIMTALFSLPIHFPYEQNAALDDLFFDEEFRNISIRKNFHDVMVEDELWQWVEGPLLDGYYNIPIRNNKRIGSVMFRTGRVQGDLCRYNDKRNNIVLFVNELCFPEFSLANEEKQAYGNASGVLQRPYTWRNDFGRLLRSQTFNPSLLNHEMDYGNGGYVVFLPRENATAAKAIVKQLKSDFLTDATRYLVVNFAFFNPRSDIFTFIQALFETSDTDYMETTARVKSFRIFSSVRDVEHFLGDNLFLAVLLLATIWLSLRELKDVRVFGWRKYLQSMWNLLDMLVLSEEIREKLLRVVAMDCSGPPSDQETAEACFVDVEPLAWRFGAITNYAAALSLISVAIVFKYLRLNNRLNLLWRTLRFAALDLLAFVAIFFTMFFGFAVMGYLTFGSAVRQYHSLSMSLTSCFQMLLGAFDYNEIYNANPAMAALFFFSFMISIYLICVNMFIAIMSEYYSLAQEEKKTYEEHKRNLIEDNKEQDQWMDVEYDLMKQIKSYVIGLQLRVRLPPPSRPLVLGHDQRVLLIDYEYLMAERKRLRRRFKSWVHTVTVCGHLLRLVRPEFTMEIEKRAIPERRMMPTSDAEEDDYAEFPVTYLPIASSIANPVEMLKRLKPGMEIEMDDGSLTKDQITLEVIGDQELYIPSSYRYTEDVEVCVMEEKRFGLRHAHPEIGDGRHIRCCRVIYNGETVVDGLETVSFPRRAWLKYFTTFVFWNFVRNLFSCRQTKSQTKRLISDVEVDRLIQEHFDAPGRGMSCRFDELVRNFRMFIAKKIHKRHLRLQHLEDQIMNEVISFLERFPSALTPLDKRELEGYKYTPQPVDTSNVRLPNSIHLLSELLSQHAHEVWAVGRIDQGWRWGPTRDNDLKLHPDLIPYEELTEETKQYDRDTSMAALKVITALGYVLEPPATQEDLMDIEFGKPTTEPGGTYVPKPIPTDDVKVPPQLRSVIELLAENTHEVWAKMRMDQGWKYGPQRNDAKREHNGLVPYIYLTNDEKQMDRNTAMQTVKLILRCGFTFTHKDKLSSSHRAKKRPSGSIKAFGRNENPEAKNVGEAVALARGISRAKQAFMKHPSRPQLLSSSRHSSSTSQSIAEVDEQASEPKETHLV